MPKLKVYTVTEANGMFPARVHAALLALGVIEPRTRQGRTLVVATSKADAAAILAVTPKWFGLAMGTDVDKLNAAGLLATPGVVLAYHHAVRDHPVVALGATTDGLAHIVGHWRLTDHVITFEKE